MLFRSLEDLIFAGLVTNEGVDKRLSFGFTLTLVMTFLSTVEAFAGCLWN